MRGTFIWITCSAFFLAPLLAAQEVPVRRHVERITASAHTWHLETGGNLDMDNTATRLHGNWEIAFQNNVALEIANVGDVPVVNPRVVVNDRGRYYSWQAMLAEFTQNAANDQERIYLIWEGLRQHRHHDYPLYGDDEYHDPVRFLNIYGGGFCDDSGMVGSALYRVAGFDQELPFVRALHGHMMCEVWYDGDYQFMDIDQDTFYLDWYNDKPVSGDTVARDHYLAMREQAYGPVLQDWGNGPVRAAALFGRDDTRSGRGMVGHAMNYTLRPGERIEFRWDHVGKHPWQLKDVTHNYFGNSRLIYALPPEHAGMMPGTATHGFESEGHNLVSKTFAPRLDVQVRTPYTIAGATLRFAWEDPTPGGIMRVEAAANGGEYKEVRTIETNGGAQAEEVALDAVLGVAGGPPCRDYTVRITGLDLIALTLRDVTLETVLYAYPIALPRLRAGDNVLEYDDMTDAPHAVEVRWQWREAEAEQGVPVPPSAPETPAHAATVTGTTVPFAWPAVEGAEMYGLRVSRAPHMRYPYRPNYDVYVNTNRYEVPYPGMFNHGETYYWQVRPRRNGAWGMWSPRWAFTWEGPMPPVDVRIEERDNGLFLLWAPNPNAPQPSGYRVHGSDERGAAPGETPTMTAPGDTTRVCVARSDGRPGEGFYAAFYRVSAVDAAGVESGPSPQAAMPRPMVYNLPDSPLAAGEAFEIALHAVQSKGDMQHRYETPPPQVQTSLEGLGWWEAEQAVITLLSGPDWVRLVSATPADGPPGAVSYQLVGTAGAAGDYLVTLHSVMSYPNEVTPSAKGAEDFRRYLAEPPERTQSFTLHVE